MEAIYSSSDWDHEERAETMGGKRTRMRQKNLFQSPIRSLAQSKRWTNRPER